VKLLLILTIVLVTSSLLQADCASTPNQWCQTYPGTASPTTPPFGRSWNNLVWDPDTHKAMTWVDDAGQVVTFSNALYGYTPQYPNVATSNSAWVRYSSCGSSGVGSPGAMQPQRSFLGTAINATDTTVSGRSDFPLTSFAASGFLWIGDEEMSYSSLSGLNFNISARGVRGTTAASHAACVGTPGTAGCAPDLSRIQPGCPAPVNGAGTPINDHPVDRHPAPVTAYRNGKLYHAGGYYEAGTAWDMWTWDPTNNWVLIPGTNVPFTHDDAMAYHADKDVLIKYGGDSARLGTVLSIYCFTVNASLGCTAANQWIKLTGTASLDNSAGHVAPSRYKHIMVYDSINKQILSVGGAPSGAPGSDAQLWSLSYNSGISKWQWTQKANMPYAQVRSPVAFDPHIGKVVLFTAAVNNINGGDGTSLGETWLYDPVADTWKQTGVTGPLIDVFAISQHMTFNPDANTLIMDKQSTPTVIKVFELPDSALAAPLTTANLNVTKGGSGTGTITSGDTFINCGSTCSHTYNIGDSTILPATPTSGHTFAGWSGDCSGTGTCVLTMSAAKNVTLAFNPPATSGPAVTLAPTSLAFGTHVVGSSTSLTDTMTNTGDATFTITSITASGDYSQTNNCGSSLAAAASCTITVTFIPVVIGPRNGSVMITDNATGSPQNLPLIGAGSAAPPSGAYHPYQYDKGSRN
jgi:ASPM-SPD-2-Hydin domain-containing protein/List-Bact-rpt repeat protein